MLDFHSHILPSIDDGSDSVETSLKLLDLEDSQGIDTVVLTPHYYIQEQEPDKFLSKREEAYQKLVKNYKGNIKLLKGCECHYYNGISKSDFIEKLCVENTNILLLELPFSRKASLNELFQLNCRVQVVLAHIERYLGMYSRKEIDEMISHGIYLQCNGEVFNKKTFKGIIKDYFEAGKIMFLGSDTHNLDERKPNLKEAYDFIEKNYSRELLDKLDLRSRSKIWKK